MGDSDDSTSDNDSIETKAVKRRRQIREQRVPVILKQLQAQYDAAVPQFHVEYSRFCANIKCMEGDEKTVSDAFRMAYRIFAKRQSMLLTGAITQPQGSLMLVGLGLCSAAEVANKNQEEIRQLVCREYGKSSSLKLFAILPQFMDILFEKEIGVN